MNHPTREEWMSYLYDELTGEQHANLAAHLAVCPDCKASVSEWRAVRKDLDTWKLPTKRARVVLPRPLVKWAAAAAIMIGFGFGVGRFAASASIDAEKLRAAIEPSIREQLRQEFVQTLRSELDRASSSALAASSAEARQLLADFVKVYESNRTEDNQAVYNAMNKLDTQRLADNATLRKELETVAVLTDFGFRRTHEQLVQLADYAQPAADTSAPQK
jgi:hypothetical protein